MFFLLRVAFWIGLVLILLPSDKSSDAERIPRIGAADAVSAASAAMSDLGQFCSRQPQACEIGGQAATVLGHRAQNGAKKVYDFLRDSPPAESDKTGDKKNAKNGDETGSIGAMQSHPELAPSSTLRPEDLVPDWRGTLSADEIVIDGKS